MKKLFPFLLIALFIYACGSQSTQSESTDTENFNPENIETVEITVTGMTCSHCEMTVQKAVKKIPGVRDVRASLTAEVAVISFDKTKTTVEKMKAAIADKGYETGNYKILTE